MSGTAAVPPAAGDEHAAGVPPLFHAAAAAWIVGMLALAHLSPAEYRQVLQEDHFIEWWTVGLFAAAAFVRFRRALPRRRVFDLLVALFCLFVAGEEFSWGQRLFGFVPPAAFLEHNTQQELNLHNFADVFGKPKGVLILALLGYGAVLPALGRSRIGARLLERAGASVPPPQTIPWFVVAAVLLYRYPVPFTGEWTEALAGALFLVSAAPAPGVFWRGGSLGAVAAVLLTLVSAHGRPGPVELACARSEVEALLNDITAGEGAAFGLRLTKGSIHKRVWTAAEDGYLDPERLHTFRAADCRGAPRGSIADRRRYFVDPWGTAYWIRAERPSSGVRRIIVYSMGPNRRRDGRPGRTTRDDVSAVGMLQVPE